MMINKVHKINWLRDIREFGRSFCALIVLLFFFAARVYSMSASGIENGETADVLSPEELTAQYKDHLSIVALKNNLLYDAILTPNLQLEFLLTERWSMEVGAGFNPFPLDDRTFPKWRHVSVTVSPRYWFCKVYNGWFVSFGTTYAHYNVAGGMYPLGWMYRQVRDYRYQGDAIMLGESGGWHWAISPHFSIEFELGVNFGYTWYDQFKCKHCGEKLDHNDHWFVLPKAGINLVVPFGGNEESLARRCDCELLEDKIDRSLRERTELSNVVLPVPVGAFDVKPVKPFVPHFEPKVDMMRRLRNRLLRNEEEYEPYNLNMALGADTRNVFMFFDVNVTKMDRTYLRNDLLMDSIMYILGEALADSTLRITRIQIVGFASFDGRQETNNKLAGGRAETIKNYIQSSYNLPDSVFAVCNGGESWAELKYHLQRVDFVGREEVVNIIDTEPDADIREKEIKRLHRGATYRYMRDELKQILRNLGCITVYVEDKDDE